MNTPEQKIFETIAADIKARAEQVAAAVELFDGGATVPFVARYRKEATGGLDDTQLRMLMERLGYLRELEKRREIIIGSIESQGKLTYELEAVLRAASTKQTLEDLYLPYRPKRRTLAAIARESGLEPLATQLFENPELVPEVTATAFVDPAKNVPDVTSALNGARNILAEKMSEDSTLLASMRAWLWNDGFMVTHVAEGMTQAGAKFRDYFDYRESVCRMPSHRALAVFRGQSEGVLKLSLEVDAERPNEPIERIAGHFGVREAGRPADEWLWQCCRWTWRVKLRASLEAEVFERLRDAAEETAIDVFGTNLRDLLLAAPAGHRRVLGLDPGIRTGVKVAAIDETGKLLATAVVFPFGSRERRAEAAGTLMRLIRRYQLALVSIGNGTASRETVEFVEEVKRLDANVAFTYVVVSEAGASVYSASELAAKEFPDLDVSYRGAVSIARRLQDPLAELVKIEPKAIGVGQYQHDVDQQKLAHRLDAVVEDCVNAVGVDVNTASPALLSHVAGLTPSRANAVVGFRSANGAFRTRKDILRVPGLGEKTFVQAAGFLRILDGADPLDASAVHPEAYPVVRRIMEKTGLDIKALIGNEAVLRTLRPRDFIDEHFGVPTVKDILAELLKPGRDPRPEFKTAKFAEGVTALTDLRPGMKLEGVVTNVAVFGAFVDVGVHQDGLVHISHLADRRVTEPREVVKVGDIVKVRVLDIDVERHRISLSMRTEGTHSQVSAQRVGIRTSDGEKRPTAGAMAAAFAKIRR